MANTALNRNVSKMSNGRQVQEDASDTTPSAVPMVLQAVMYKHVCRHCEMHRRLSRVRIGGIACSCMYDLAGFDVAFNDTCEAKDPDEIALAKGIQAIFSNRSTGRERKWVCSKGWVNRFIARWSLRRFNASSSTWYCVDTAMLAIGRTLVHAWSIAMAAGLDPEKCFLNTDQTFQFVWDTKQKAYAPAHMNGKGRPAGR
jgi:hypothetical protein